MADPKDSIEFIEALNAKIYGEHVTFEEMRQTINEITGISDLMRGESVESSATLIAIKLASPKQG